MFCRFCGTQNASGAAFCRKCGKKFAGANAAPQQNRQPQQNRHIAPQNQNVAPRQNVRPAQNRQPQHAPRPAQYAGQAAMQHGTQAVRQATPAVVRQVTDLFSGNAVDAPGEYSTGIFADGPGNLANLARSGMAAAQGVASGVRNASSAQGKRAKFRTGLAVLSAVAIAIFWIIQLVWVDHGTENAATILLNWLTFAKGGLNRSNFGGFVGGMVGKGAVAAALAGLCGGGVSALRTGFKRTFSRSNFRKNTIGFLLMGAGIALIFYQFFTGDGGFAGAMAGLSGMLVTCRSLGGRAGMIFSLVKGVTAKKTHPGSKAPSAGTTAMLAGLTMGFAIAAQIAILPLTWMHLVLGINLVIVGLILALAMGGSGRMPQPANFAAFILIFALVFPFTAEEVLAAEQTFTIRMFEPNVRDDFPNGELDACMRGDVSYFCSMESIIGYGNPRIGRQASDGSFTAPDALWDVILNYYLMNAGDITVTCSEDFVHVELPAISMSGSAPYNMYDMNGTTRISIEGDAMSFTGSGLYHSNGNHYSDGGDLYLDAPVTITESYDIWDGQVMDQGTCTATLNSQASFSFSFDLNDNGEVDYVYIQLTPYWDYKTGAGVEIRDSGRDTLNDQSFDRSGEMWPDKISLSGDNVEIFGFSGSASSQNDESVNREAKDTAGEEGYDISEDLVEGKKDQNREEKSSPWGPLAVGVVGTMVAGGGGAAAAAAGNKTASRSADDAEEEKKKYKMYVAKNFGNRLKKGGKPVEVCARIVEVDMRTGMEKNCPELSQKITGSGRSLTVSDNGMKGVYKSVLISVPKDAPAGDVVLTFTYVGLGGTFRNNLTFHVMPEVAMWFPEVGSGGGWILHPTGTVDAIAGDRAVYTVRFFLENATEEAKDFSFSSASEKFAMESCVQDPKVQFTYLASIRNLSEPKDDADLFAKPDRSDLTLTAVFADGSSVSGDVTATLYKEGLSAEVQQVEVKDGNIQVDCYLKEGYYGDDVDPKKIFIYPRLLFTLAVPSENGAQIITDGLNLSFESLKGTDEASNNMAQKFRYELNRVGDNQCFFIQQQELFAYEQKPWPCLLPVTASYGTHEAHAELPFALYGAILPPYSDTEKELKKLLWVMRHYIEDDAERAEWVAYVKDYLGNGKVSGRALRMMSRQIYDGWYTKAIARTDQWLFWSDCYDQWITTADWVKYIAVLSFTYVAKAYAFAKGGEFAADLTEALVQPAATLFLDSVEELTDASLNQRTFDVKNIKLYEQISSMGDNVAFNMASGSVMEHPEQLGKNLMIIGAYLAYSACRNFLQHMAETGEADFPGAIWGAFKDLTMNTIKKIASELFKTWMKSDAFKKVAGNTIAEAIINFFKDTIQGFGTSEITQKLLDEAFGAGLTKLVENLENGDLTFKPADGQGGDFYFTFVLCKKSNGKDVYCELNLNAILEYHSGSFSRLFEAVYSKLFGTFSGAPAPVTFPDDPPPVSKEELTANKEKLEASINKQNEIFERFLDKVEEASKNTVL